MTAADQRFSNPLPTLGILSPAAEPMNLGVSQARQRSRCLRRLSQKRNKGKIGKMTDKDSNSSEEYTPEEDEYAEKSRKKPYLKPQPRVQRSPLLDRRPSSVDESATTKREWELKFEELKAQQDKNCAKVAELEEENKQLKQAKREEEERRKARLTCTICHESKRTIFQWLNCNHLHCVDCVGSLFTGVPLGATTTACDRKEVREMWGNPRLTKDFETKDWRVRMFRNIQNHSCSLCRGHPLDVFDVIFETQQTRSEGHTLTPSLLAMAIDEPWDADLKCCPYCNLSFLLPTTMSVREILLHVFERCSARVLACPFASESNCKVSIPVPLIHHFLGRRSIHDKNKFMEQALLNHVLDGHCKGQTCPHCLLSMSPIQMVSHRSGCKIKTELQTVAQRWTVFTSWAEAAEGVQGSFSGENSDDVKRSLRGFQDLKRQALDFLHNARQFTDSNMGLVGLLSSSSSSLSSSSSSSSTSELVFPIIPNNLVDNISLPYEATLVESETIISDETMSDERSPVASPVASSSSDSEESNIE